MTQQESVAHRIANLAHLSMADLWQQWDQFFVKRPKHVNRKYVESRLAYKIQEEVFGSLSTSTRKRLEDLGAQHSKIKLRTQERILLTPGTVLMREWGKQEHRVLVKAEGHFEYEGKAFKSLSAVARHITGTAWSGPLFFGLKKTRRA